MISHSRTVHEPPSVERVRRAASQIARRHGYQLVVLFGSLARGDPRPRDIDIAVRGPEPVDTVQFTNELIRELRFQHIDVSCLLSADPLLQVLVAREGLPLYERAVGEFGRFCSLAARRFADTAKFRELERARIRDFVERTSSSP